MVAPESQLANGLSSLGFQPKTAQIKQLLQYLDIMLKTNQSLNLTAIKTLDAAIDLHILDSLTLKPWIDSLPNNSHILDIGSGAGLPGIPLAIMYPDLNITLLDARKKKMVACDEFINTLTLANINTVHARIESLQPKHPYAMVVSRAVSGCQQLLTWLEPIQYEKLIVMKGQNPESELKELTHQPQITQVFIPGRNDQRHILVF